MYGYDIFHEEIMNDLIKTVREGKTQQAYIFEGDEGLGTAEAARLFANALVCSEPQTAPCRSCHACVCAEAGTSPDIIHISSGDKKSIGVEKMREMIGDAYIKPFEASKKVYIIDDGTRLTEAAQNSLLKLLEEPPEYAVFIILVGSAGFLLQTVLSRCVTVRFYPLERGKIKEYIEKKYPGTGSDFAAAFSQGNPGVADKMLANPDFEEIRKKAFEVLPNLFSKKRLTAYTVCEFVEGSKENTELIFDFWLSLVRDIMLCQSGADALIMNVDMQEEIKNIAFKLNEKYPIIVIECLITAKKMLRRYVNLHGLLLNLSFSIKKRLAAV